jgi:hypothetical protein
MKITRILLFLSFVLTFASATYAQTYVSSTGNDSGSCPITAPCKTLQYAVSHTPAFGQLDVLSDGTYDAVYVDNAITINGHGFAANFTAGILPPITAQAGVGSVVIIRDIILHGSGSIIGIYYNFGSELMIDHVKIDNISGNCIDAAIDSSLTSPVDLVIKDTTIANCSGAGISITSPSGKITAEISNTQVHYANGGLLVNNGLVTVFGSTFSPPTPGGQHVGISVVSANSASAAQVMLDNCEVSNWGTAISSGKGESVLISRSTINFNTNGLVSVGGAIVSNGNNSFYGNGADGTPTSTAALK